MSVTAKYGAEEPRSTEEENTEVRLDKDEEYGEKKPRVPNRLSDVAGRKPGTNRYFTDSASYSRVSISTSAKASVLRRQFQYDSYSVLLRQLPIKNFFRNSSIRLNV